LAKEIPVEVITLIAAADLSAKQYYAVKIDATGKAAMAGAGQNAVGILRNNPTADQPAAVMVLGIALAMYGGAVTAGDNLMTDANGKLITATGTNPVVCVAMESGADGEVHSVILVTRTSTGINANNSVLAFPIALAKIANGDLMTNIVPGFAGTIKKIFAVVNDPATTAAKTAALHVEIGAVATTGGVLTLTSANMTPLGAKVDGTAITGANTFTATDTLSIVAASTTAFVEGSAVIYIVLG
jgi:hypothetical protein